MKYKVKVGQDFDPAQEMTVTIEVEVTTSEEQESKKSGLFADWKVLSVAAVFTLILLSGIYAAVTGDASLHGQLLDVAVKVATEHPKGKNAKEND
ncbi:hypothetical protein [Microcoleus sp. AT3-D2]|uniref:hypothetical protein n=1 Tax=Microcoleus sp. AT3-D2 TaxID=2818612 RepID=UPI002FD25BF2